LRTRSSEETRPAIVAAEQISTQKTETMGYLFFYGIICSLPTIFENISNSTVQNVKNNTHGVSERGRNVVGDASTLLHFVQTNSIVVSSCGGKGVGAR
jgi:hypothetical protein